MYEDRTYDNIMDEMMSGFGSNVRTDEGSLAFNSCAKQAEQLEEFYGDLSELNDNILPDTMDDWHLIEYGRERNVQYRYATAPVVKAEFLQEIDIGERFTCNDYTYTVKSKLSNFCYELECETEGTAANATLGDLYPVDYVDEYKGGSIVCVITAGTDDEDIEVYRQKIMSSLRSVAFAGNKAAYRTFINNIDGVGGCKPFRREKNSDYINVYVISNAYTAPSPELISKVQTAVDPEENHGEGIGLAPICHSVLIKPVEEISIAVRTHIEFETGRNADTMLQAVETVIADYLHSLAQQWESKEKEAIVVRQSQIEACIIGLSGIIDVSDTSLNGADGNVIIPYTAIPVMGGVEIV